jgi:hypothetical protein
LENGKRSSAEPKARSGPSERARASQRGRRPDEGKCRTGEGHGENFNNLVAEILSRSRKVRTQIPNKTNFVTARDDGAKGQQPTHGRAGAGLANPAGTGRFNSYLSGTFVASLCMKPFTSSKTTSAFVLS